MRISGITWSVLTLVVLVEYGYASGDVDRQMLNLARDHGCILCHDFQPDAASRGQTLPMAPSWREIAKRYESVNNADERLTQSALDGIGPRPGERHSAGKVSAASMLPNAVESEPHDARSLVHWMLSLE